MFDEGIGRFDSRFGRRSMLRGAALSVSGLAAAALIGCGDDDEDAQQPDAASTAAATATTAAKTSEDSKYPLNFPEPAGKTPKAGGALVQAVSWDVGPIDPTVSAAGGSIGPARSVYNRLIGFVAGPQADAFALKLRPELADRWESAPDGLTHTFKLHPGVKWQNVAPVSGRDFKAADVKFAFDRYAAGGAQKQYFWNVKEVSAPDDLTVVIKLNGPQPDFLIPLGSRYLTIHPHEIVDDGSIGRTAIGTGPMILKEAKAGTRVFLEKNPDYWERKVMVDSLEHRVIPSAASRLAAFRAGQVEHGISTVASEKELEALLGTNANTQVTLTPVLNTYFAWAFNLTNPKYQDERVRRALSLGIDRATMTTVALGKLGLAVPSIPWIYLYDKAPTAESGALGKWWRYAPVEAKQLLSAAGVSDLSLDLTYTDAYGPAQVQLSEIFTDQLRSVGVKVNLQSADYTSYNGQWTQVNYPDMLDGWGANGFDADNFFWNYHHSKAPGNRYYIKDVEIDQWAEAQRRELNPAARKELHQRIWNKVLDQVYRIDKPYPAGFDVMQPWLRNVRFTGANLANYSFTEIGAQIQYAWLDK